MNFLMKFNTNWYHMKIKQNVLQFKSLNDLANELNANTSRRSLLSSDDDQNQDESPPSSQQPQLNKQAHKQITVNKICKSRF